MNLEGLGKSEAEKDKKRSQMDGVSKKFLDSRQVLISGEINEELANDVISKILLLESVSATKPIYLYINSPGGNVYSGFSIFDIIRFVKPPVKIIGAGLVASAAALILLSVEKKDRFSLPNSQYLIHQPLSEMRGVATDLEIHAREIERIKQRINEIIAKETGKGLEEVFRDTERDYWLNAIEAVDYGLVSKILETKKDLPVK